MQVGDAGPRAGQRHRLFKRDIEPFVGAGCDSAMERRVADFDRESRVRAKVACGEIEGPLLALQSSAVVAVGRISISKRFQRRDAAFHLTLRPNGASSSYGARGSVCRTLRTRGSARCNLDGTARVTQAVFRSVSALLQLVLGPRPPHCCLFGQRHDATSVKRM